MWYTLKCDATNQLKKDCSSKPINLKFGEYVYHVSKHLQKELRITIWNEHHKYRFLKDKNYKKHTRRSVNNTEWRERPEKYGQAEFRTQFALKLSKNYPFLCNLNVNQP